MKHIDRLLGIVLRGIPIACLAALFTLLFINVIARTFQLAGFAWFDEIVQGLFAWMVFIGTAGLWREHDHFQVTWLAESLTPVPRRILQLLVIILALFFLATMTWYGASLTLKARALTPILALPTALFYVAIPISGGVMTGYTIVDLFQLLMKRDPSP